MVNARFVAAGMMSPKLSNHQLRCFSPSLRLSKSSVVRDDEDLTIEDSELNNKRLNEEKTVEEMYSRKTPLEHVLLRPGMYVGAVERLPPIPYWVADCRIPPPSEANSHVNVSMKSMKMVRNEYGIVPALIKVFDEILVNASDNKLRHPDTCNRIDVIIDPGSADKDPYISVYNDGKGIPVQVRILFF